MSALLSPPDRPVRIGFLVPTTRNGGAEAVVLRWATEAARRGHDVFVYTFLPTDQAAAVPANVTHVHRDFGSTLGRWISLPRWIRARSQNDALDVLVSALSHANLVALVGLKVLARPDVPVVISEHSLPSLLLGLDRRGARTKLWLLRRLYRLADAVVAVSHAVATDLVSRFRIPSDRVVVVPNPVLEMTRSPAPKLPQSVHLAFVGRLVPQKAPRLVVQTLASLAELGVSVRGTFVGDGPLREELAADARRARVPVRFAGWRPRWQDEVRECDCLLLPSDVEGFGNVLVEAAAAGIPSVVCSRALGVADAVIPGVTGELVAFATPGALAAGVIRAIHSGNDDPLRAWLCRFTPESSVDVLFEVIRGVTGKPALDAAKPDLNCGFGRRAA